MFTNANIKVAGTASHPSGIQGVTVKDLAASLVGTNWSRAVTLTTGTNVLTVIAIDASPNQNAATQTVHAVFAPGCHYSIAPAGAEFDAADGSNTVSVTAGLGCAWTATSHDAWLVITSGGSGSGNGAVHYTVAPHSNTTARVGSLMIAGQTFTVNQAGAPVIDRYALELLVAPAGAGSIAANPAPGDDGKYAAGASVNLTPQSAFGAKFSHWTGSTPPVSMTTNQSVTAHFVADETTPNLPLGDWEVAIKGADTGLAFLTFAEDFTWRGHALRLRLDDVSTLTGTWWFAAKSIGLRGGESVDGQQVWQTVGSIAKVAAGKKLAVQLPAGNGAVFKWAGKPAVDYPDLSGVWLAVVKKVCPVNGEVYVIAPDADGEHAFPAVFELSGAATGKLIVGAKGQVFGHLDREGCLNGVSTVSGKFNAAKLSLKLKGVTATGLKFSLGATPE